MRTRQLALQGMDRGLSYSLSIMIGNGPQIFRRLGGRRCNYALSGLTRHNKGQLCRQ